MITHWKKGIIFILLALVSLPSFAGVATLQTLRSSASEKEARLVLLGTQPLSYTVFELPNPNRLVIDFKDTRLAPGFNVQAGKNAWIKSVRSSHQANAVRLVFDLKFPVHYKASLMNSAGASRLIIDLSASTQAPQPNSQKPLQAAAISTPKTIQQDLAISGTNKVVIVIDPGHGGKDTGAIGQRHSYEKNAVLAISKQLQIIINRQPGFKAVLTRSGDYYLSLRQRLTLARNYKADMFVAIHADAFRDHKAHGAAVYALSQRGATSEAALWIAERENESELMGGVDLNDKDSTLKSVLLNLSQTATIQSSLTVGYQVLLSMGHVCSLHHRRVEQAAFVVLKSPDIPSLLVECGFISNWQEESRLTSAPSQRQIANSLAQGIISYFKSNPPRGSWLASHR